MVFVEPEQGIGGKKIPDLVPAVVEDMGAPFQVLALTFILMLIEGCTVEARQAVAILGEMGGNPVQDNPKPVLMAFVDKILEIRWSAETGCNRVKSCHLVAP